MQTTRRALALACDEQRIVWDGIHALPVAKRLTGLAVDSTVVAGVRRLRMVASGYRDRASGATAWMVLVADGLSY